MSSSETTESPWYRSTLAIALFGSLLMWGAQPPLALGWLGWVAPVPWLLLVGRQSLTCRHPSRALWLAGFAFWLAAIHWLRLPHPAVYLGWLALSAYLGCYLPVFVWLSRVAVHRLRVPLWLAAPVVWTGLELARAHLLTGFMMGSLAHTQVKWITFIQISDLAGEYGVDFVMMLVAACIANVLVLIIQRAQRAGASSARELAAAEEGRESAGAEDGPARLRIAFNLLPAVIVLPAALAYGNLVQLDARSPSNRRPPIRIALIQGNSLADWKLDQAKQQQIMEEYIGLSRRAVAEASKHGNGKPLDLIVWPETMYRNPLREFDPGFAMPAAVEENAEEISAADRRMLSDMAVYLGSPLLVGVDRIRFLADSSASADRPSIQAWNSSALVDSAGQILGTYDKFHLVMFGEYVPFSRWLPFLKRLSSLTGSVEAGEGPVALCNGDICYAPNICYETVIPHVIRRQVTELAAQNKKPDVLVNLTNDAWYWGSSELDMHLACDVFRAIETRTPLVIAANGGISASIDRFGNVLAQSPRQQPDVLIAEVERESRTSYYMRFGDWFAAACLTACIALAIIGWTKRRT